MTQQRDLNADPELSKKGQAALGTSGHWISPEGIASLKHHFDKYSDDLIDGALTVARENLAQQVSPTHLEEANRRVREKSRGSWLIKLSGSLGGMLLGASVAQVIDRTVKGSANSIELLIIFTCAVLGTACTIFHALKS